MGYRYYLVPVTLGDPAGLGPGIVTLVENHTRRWYRNGQIILVPTFAPFMYEAHNDNTPHKLQQFATFLTEAAKLFSHNLGAIERMVALQQGGGDLTPWGTNELPEIKAGASMFDLGTLQRIEQLEAENARLRKLVAELGGDTAVALAR
jgi:hypothetical protein